MKTGQFHRAWWDEESSTGIAKIHYEPLGIVAFTFECGDPVADVNVMDENEVLYWRRHCKKRLGRPLRGGFSVDHDIDLVVVTGNNTNFIFEELNLEIEQTPAVDLSLQINSIDPNSINRAFRLLNKEGEWINFQNAPIIKYKPCNSLICIS